MNRATPSLRQLAGVLACMLVLFGTTGAATLDALLHAGQAHASQHEGGGAPESHGTDCLLCVAAAAPAAASVAPAHGVASAPAADDAVAPRITRAPHAATHYLTPPGRGPPTA
jgi:hypothetical protein